MSQLAATTKVDEEMCTFLHDIHDIISSIAMALKRESRKSHTKMTHALPKLMFKLDSTSEMLDSLQVHETMEMDKQITEPTGNDSNEIEATRFGYSSDEDVEDDEELEGNYVTGPVEFIANWYNKSADLLPPSKRREQFAYYNNG